MAKQSWTLFDTSQPDLTPPSLPEGIRWRTLEHGLSAGVQVLEVSNGKLTVVLLPTRGMSIWKAIAHTALGSEEIGWKSPVQGPVHPQYVPVMEPSGLGWLDGFDELLVRCGLESNGAPEFGENGELLYPLHGRIANKPAHRVAISMDQDTGDIEVTGWVRETRFHFLKAELQATMRIKADQPGFEIVDTLTNLSASPAELQMLYHVNFGHPLLDAGSHVVTPVAELVPRNAHAASAIGQWDSYLAETPGYVEQVYFAKLQADGDGNTATLLRNAHGTRGALLRYNVQQLPCLTIWKNTTASEDGYVTGIEPGSNFPNPRSFEGQRGRVIALDGLASTSNHLSFEYCDSEAAVARAEAEVKSLQATSPTIHPEPLPEWCA